MAVYIPIRKVREDGDSVVYRFGDDRESRWGMLRLDKRSGEVTIIEPAPGDEHNRLSRPAARKVFLHWQEGSFPDETCRAS
jgi:hypothetical protein